MSLHHAHVRRSLVVAAGLIVVTLVATAAVSGASLVGDRTPTVVGPPTVTIEQGATQLDPAHGDTIVFDVVFSRAVTGFDGSDVVIGGDSGATTATVTAIDGSHYTVGISGMVPQLGSVAVFATIPAGAAQAVDDAQLSAASTSIDNGVRWFGRWGPDAFVDQAEGQADPTSGSTVQFFVRFSRSIQAFGGVALSGTAAAGTTQTFTPIIGPIYLVTVSGMTQSGTLIATVPSGSVRGLTDGQPNLPSTSTDNIVTWIKPGPVETTTTTTSTTTSTTSTVTSTSTTVADTTTTTAGGTTTTDEVGALGATASSDPTDPTSGTLPVTGSDTGRMVLLGIGLTVLGYGLLTISRRRRAEYGS